MRTYMLISTDTGSQTVVSAYTSAVYFDMRVRHPPYIASRQIKYFSYDVNPMRIWR